MSLFSSLRPARRLAAANLFEEKLRLSLSVLGVALSVMLILILLGLRAGVYKGVRAYLENSPGSIVVLPKGARTTFAVAGKQLPPGTAEAVTRVDGVARVTPLLRMGSIPDLHGKKEYVVLVGYDHTSGGGPWELASGREPVADNEVVLDRVLAQRHGFSVGQTFTLAGQALTVVGLSSGTNSWVGTYVFATKTFVEKLVLVSGATNVLLVTPAPGLKTSDLIGRLGSVPDASALAKSEVIEDDQKVIAGVFNQVLSVMVVTAFLVGTLVVGMVIYTATIERRRGYGVLRALGARSSTLYGTVIVQALMAAGLGVALGVGLAYAAGLLIAGYRPQFIVSIEPSALLMTLAAGFLIALFGAFVPARTVTRLAPAEVFRR